MWYGIIETIKNSFLVIYLKKNIIEKFFFSKIPKTGNFKDRLPVNRLTCKKTFVDTSYHMIHMVFALCPDIDFGQNPQGKYECPIFL